MGAGNLAVLGVIAVGIAISLAIAALTIGVELQMRVESLEKREKESVVVPPPAQTIVRESVSGGNQFYSGVDLQKLLDKPIFGKALFGDLDQYDLIHPAILAEGSVLVRGSGRLVLDGDASDLILKIDNEYFSLRELFGIGQGIDSTPRPSEQPENREGADYADYVGKLCSGVSLFPAVTCPARRNFGTDSCEGNVCYCGGGYDYLTRTVLHRHFVCKENQNCSDVFFGNHLNAYCCAPGADEDFFYCNAAYINATSTNPEAYCWIDRYAQCGQDTDGTLCKNVDKEDYLDMYNVAGIKDNLLNNAEDLVSVRKRINLHSWGITRDFVFDNGDSYHIELRHDVYADCPEPRLTMLQSEEFLKSYAAVWTCVDEGSAITFSRANQEEILNNFEESNEWGSLYYALVQSEERNAWYCLTKALSAQEKNTIVGSVFTTKTNQVFFIKYTDETRHLCATVYLGSRDIGDHVPEKSIGFETQDPDRVVVTNPNKDSGKAYAVIPV